MFSIFHFLSSGFTVKTKQMSAQTSNNKQDLSLINRQQVIGHLVKR